jgi:glycosyltransferase involved in cell wall biosynthesis
VVDVEVIVVDDGPTDESPAKVEAASLANPGAIRLLRQPRNLGPAAARNVGLRHARAGLSAFLTLTINTPRVFLFGRSSISVSDRNSRRSLPTSNW